MNPQGFGPSPYDPTNPYSTLGGPPGMHPPRKSNAWLWILGIGGGILGLGLLCCGCFGGLFYFGWGQMNEMVKQQIQNDPVIQEHIGEVYSVSANVMATGQEVQANPPPPGDNVLVFDVKGSKGSGQLVGTQLEQPAPGRFLRDMRLKKDGQVYPLSQ
jgi:hypothetical protein